MSNWLDKIDDEKVRLTPAPGSGWNVVGVDAFEAPGSALYFVGNYATEAEADKVAAMFTKDAGTGDLADRYYVYAPDDSGDWVRSGVPDASE